MDGSVRVHGAKNAILPILAACLLTEESVRLVDCPSLRDVDNMILILQTLGCKIQRNRDVLDIDASGVNNYIMPPQLSKQLRSSIFMLGPVLGRFKQAHFTYPGGCEIGNRPIDLHLKGLAMLNAEVKEEYGNIICNGKNLKGAHIHLDYPSVGATENIMMAAVAAKGETVIQNAAREPEIEALQGFLQAMGFFVEGAGSSTIVIKGGCRPKPVEYRIMPDRIVAGTLMCAAAITGGRVQLTNVISEHIGHVIAKLRECGCYIKANADTGIMEVTGPERPKELRILETLPHPGFPTDMQAQMFAVCCVVDGISIIVENVFENRFKHAAELARMGAISTQKGSTAIIRGVPNLFGAEVCANDLRGGAALCLAGLRALGETTVNGVEHVDRGYDKLDDMLNSLGARIVRVEQN